MRRTITALIATALIAVGAGGSAAAAQKSPHCKVLVVQQVTQTRDVSGVIMGVTYVKGQPVYTYGHGVQHRTQTTTKQRCRGKLSTAVTYSPWTY